MSEGNRLIYNHHLWPRTIAIFDPQASFLDHFLEFDAIGKVFAFHRIDINAYTISFSRRGEGSLVMVEGEIKFSMLLHNHAVQLLKQLGHVNLALT